MSLEFLPLPLYVGVVCAHVALIFGATIKPAVAQVNDVQNTLPENAHVRTHGEGWECKWGFVRLRESCEEIELPLHAYLSEKGTFRECERGYQNINDASCVVLEIPESAHLDYKGNSWECDQSYRQNGYLCEPNQ